MRLIDADSLKEHLDYVCVGGGKWGDAEKAFINAFKDFVDGEITIQLEPKSAQQWIPLIEAEPQEDGKYLICDECGFIDTAFYEEDDFEIIVTPNRITAWMPLPEPWKGE